ncbi:MAG: hypothetical protein K2Q23_09035 [Bryobacteraceae bacterium]|nr:hypothetical protein [Bryobacteraceae bacterium]
MRLAVFLTVAAAVRAKEPTPAVQVQLQESLRQLTVAFNDGDLDAAVRQVHPEFTWRGQSAGYALSWA